MYFLSSSIIRYEKSDKPDTQTTQLTMSLAQRTINSLTLKVPVGDVARTSAAVARLLDDEELYRRLVANDLDVVRDKSVSRRIKQVESLYNSLVAQWFSGE